MAMARQGPARPPQPQNECMKMEADTADKSNYFEFSHMYNSGPLERTITVNGMEYQLYSRIEDPKTIGKYLSVTVWQKGLKKEEKAVMFEAKLEASYDIFPNQWCPAEKDTLDREKNTSRPLLNRMGFNLNPNVQVTIKLTFEPPRNMIEPFEPRTLAQDVEAYVDEGKQLTLIGRDGSTMVSKRLFKIRSRAFDVMFKHNLREKQTSEVVMDDFDVKTLEAFKHFLKEEEIENGSETAVGLYLLADKYDVPALRIMSEAFILKNLNHFDKDEIFDIFVAINRPLVVNGFFRNYLD